MSDTKTHSRAESSPPTTQYERYLRYLEQERERDAAKGSASKAIGYRRPRRVEDVVDEPTMTASTERQTRLFQRETLRSAGPSGRLVIRIINEYGKPEKAIHCSNITQCREVVRVETPLYEPGSLFFIADGTRPIENWAIGKDGLPKRGRTR